MKNSVKVIFALCLMFALTVSAAAKPADELIADIYAADSEAKAEIQECLDEYAKQIALMARSCNPDAPPDIEVTLAALKSDNAMRCYDLSADFRTIANSDIDQYIVQSNDWYIPLYEGKIDIYCSYDDDLGEWTEPSVSTGKFDAGNGCMGYEHAAELLAQKGITDIIDMKFLNSVIFRINFMYIKTADGVEYLITLDHIVENYGLEQQKVYQVGEVYNILKEVQTPQGNDNIGMGSLNTDYSSGSSRYNKNYSSTDIWAIVFVVAAGLALCLGGGCLIYRLVRKK